MARAHRTPVPRTDSPSCSGVFELYRQMWHFATGARGWLLASSSMLIGSQTLKLLVPWLAAHAIGALQDGGAVDPIATCLPWVGATLAVYLAGWALHGPGRVIERSVAVRVRRALTRELYARLARAPLAWHESHHSAELSHRMGQASQALSEFTQSQFIYLQNAVNLVGPLLALAMLSSVTGALAVVGLGGVAVIIVAFDRSLIRLAREENRAERRFAALAMDCLLNISTVLSLRLQASTGRLLARRLAVIARPLKRSIVLNEAKWCAVDVTSMVLTWALVISYAWRADHQGAALLGGIFMAHQYAQQAAGVIGTLASQLQGFSRIRADFASAAPIWDAPDRHRTPLHPAVGHVWTEQAHAHASAAASAAATASKVGPEARTPWTRIDLCGLGYEHAGGEDAQRGGLRDVTLRLHAGERIALVGGSGAGKSTLLRLLAGLYEPGHGHVEVDGVATLGVRDLGAFATLIPQEAQVFEASVRENLCFDQPCSDEALRRAAHTASFESVLDALPLGLDTPITQGGFNLSGGQRQRLCLARGIVAARGSSILLLDEPTSALDPISEAAVYERLDAAFPQACIVASVHRMSLLAHFDRIVLMAEGRVVDAGTPDELLARQASFREMVGGDAGPRLAPVFALTAH